MSNLQKSNLRRNISYPIATFLIVFILHAIYTVYKFAHSSDPCIQAEDKNLFGLYFKQQDYLLGLSYALAGAFTVYAFLKFLEKQRRVGATGLISGITLTGAIYLLGCFFIGCCGSPMLAVYLGFLGPSFLGFAKPLVLIFTTTSVLIGYLWMKKKSKTPGVCCGRNETDIDVKGMTVKDAINKIKSELAKGIKLAKCKKCGCMKDVLIKFRNQSDLSEDIAQWLNLMESIEYNCLGCKYCFPAVAMNIFTSSSFEVKEKTWPVVAGEYFAFCDGTCPVAISTLASHELSEKLAKIRPKELCIVGKTETENIGIDKLIKNTITNPFIHFILLTGKDPEGHYSGKTLLALKENGVDEHMRVIGSPARQPILKNVSLQEIETFRRQVQVVDMSGCEDVNRIVEKVKELSQGLNTSSNYEKETLATESTQTPAPVIQAKESLKKVMDKNGYFLVIPESKKGLIVVEHYSYDNKLLRVIEGKDAKSIYSTIIDNGWITDLSHAAYLGRELSKAELSIKLGFKYIQDGA